jgi:hypothetical protein
MIVPVGVIATKCVGSHLIESLFKMVIEKAKQQIYLAPPQSR